MLPEENALDLLKTLAPTAVIENLEASLELVRELQGSPLAIQVAGGLSHTEASHGFGMVELLQAIRVGAKHRRRLIAQG
jgi:hypothetical protein